jgi:hypothetical protein
MDFQTLAEAQVRDAVLLQQAQTRPLQVQRKLLAPGVYVYCHIPTPGGPWKVILPGTLLRNVVRWYHLALGYCGISRSAGTLRMHFHHSELQQVCEDEVKNCVNATSMLVVGMVRQLARKHLCYHGKMLQSTSSVLGVYPSVTRSSDSRH